MPKRGPALVITPTYNERENVVELVRRLFADGGEFELLIVDDGSPDGTADAVEELAAHHPITVIRRRAKLGLGTAYVTGFAWALQRDYWAIVEMDADLSHDPADVPRLLKALEDADLVIGSRYVRGGTVEDWGPSRKALSRSGNAYARAWLGVPVRDSTSGFRAYRATALAEIDLSKIKSEGYAFQIELTRRIWRSGGRIVELPIKFADRNLGRSKMSRGIALEALARVTRWGVQDRFGRGHKKRP